MSEDKTAIQEAEAYEKMAESFFRERRSEEAFQAYREAAILFRAGSEHLRAARAFAQAAHAEKVRMGRESAREAAGSSEDAAREAVKAREFAYARWLYREAGLLYESEGDFERYSRCFMEAQDTYLVYLREVMVSGKRQERFDQPPVNISWLLRLKAACEYAFGQLSRLAWGYGERPFRLMVTVVVIVFLSAGLYMLCGPVRVHQTIRPVSFDEALYMSGVTFATVGYGDYVPLGWMSRLVAVLEAFGGLFTLPLFLVALTRRYLRFFR